MQTVVVDTDVVSYLFKQDTRAILYQPHLLQALPAISFMTLAEMERWALVKNWGGVGAWNWPSFYSRMSFYCPMPHFAARGQRSLNKSREVAAISILRMLGLRPQLCTLACRC